MLAQVTVRDVLRALTRLLTEQFDLFLAVLVLVLALVLGYGVTRLLRGVMERIGVPEVVEGTPFERTVQRVGFSTVGLVSKLSGLFVVAVGVVLALRLVGVLTVELFVAQLVDYLPNLFIAALVIIVGLILGDKAELATSERLRSVKLPEVTLVPTLVKYSVFYVAFLIALAQLGVMVAALLVLLAAYSFGVFFLGGLAFKDMLSSAAAGVYLLLTEPYTIGDEVGIDGRRGIVQEIDVFVTRIESEGEEHVVPNRHVFQEGIVRVRGE
jgi:small-conductance mechanosensitive channel